jgi:hypothetical protein
LPLVSVFVRMIEFLKIVDLVSIKNKSMALSTFCKISTNLSVIY